MLTSRFVEALGYACDAHQTQKRKKTEIPYVAHLLSVCALVLEDGGSEVEAIAALLHDVAEDQGGERRLDEIRERFGLPVEEIVRACSDSLTEDPREKAPWIDRKRTYLAHLAVEARDGVLRVSAADKLHNARAVLADYRRVGEALWTRFSGGREGTLWYYRSIANELALRRPGSPLVQELGRTVTELSKLAAR